MKNYTIEFNGRGESISTTCRNDDEAVAWAEQVLAAHGYDSPVAGDWDCDGYDDDGRECRRMLFWASEQDAQDDPGVSSVCALRAMEA